ncbi:MAG: carbon-nitrogen hydrolase [Verrucomicrobiales bacterium]|nr:carbon-nitrogen hydrolase [Verrucomicrobiales bacterium]
MKIGLIQSTASPEIEQNVRKTMASVRSAAKRGARIVCLEEFFASLYFCQTCESSPFELAEPLESAFIGQFRELAAELEIVLVLSWFEKQDEGVFFNSALVIDVDGSIAGHYRKMHIPDDAQFHEKHYFAPGDLGFCAAETRYGTIGVCICWDQWFPEAARLTALAGAEIIFIPTSIGWHEEDIEAGLKDSQFNAWQTIQKSHAIANSCFVAAVNRCGTEAPSSGAPPIQFWGHSFVTDPHGTILAEAGESDEVLLADVDFAEIAPVRRMWNFFRDRRIDAYSGILKRSLKNAGGSNGES